MAKLVLLSEGLTGRSYELKVDRTTVGRVDDNAFPIIEASVSSHHCELLLRGGDVIVKDLNSTNGTFINGEKITEAALKPGQILRLGQVEMRLESGTSIAASTEKKKLEHTMVILRGEVERARRRRKSAPRRTPASTRKATRPMSYSSGWDFPGGGHRWLLVYALVKSSGPGQ
jgi:predicted component of type VI protein secretion system